MKTKLIILFALSLGACLNAQSVPTAVYVGKPLEITVAVGSGTPPFVFAWTKNGAQWTPPVPPVISPDGMKAVLTIPSAQLTDAGSYLVNVSNSAGNVSTPSAAVTVAQVIVLPGNVTLTAIAR